MGGAKGEGKEDGAISEGIGGREGEEEGTV